MSAKELFEIAEKMDAFHSEFDGGPDHQALQKLEKVTGEFDRAWSHSWLGYHANVYYADLQPPPPGDHFSSEWGFKTPIAARGTTGDWREFDPIELRELALRKSGNPDLEGIRERTKPVAEGFDQAKSATASILQPENPSDEDRFIADLVQQLEKLKPGNPADVLRGLAPSRQLVSRDSLAVSQGLQAPVHLALQAECISAEHVRACCADLAKISRKAASHLERKAARQVAAERVGTNVFLGHGRSQVWRDLKDFLQDRLGLPWDEFNRVQVAGIPNQVRLAEMLDAAAVAFIVMTAEDETAEGTMQARMNVIHEVGFFQGRLGFTKAIVLLEEGCEEFSNIEGVGQIRFPKGNISAKFEEIREVLEREGVIPTEEH